VLATQVDGTILVIDSAHTRRALAQRSKEILDAVGAKILGAVFNRAPAPHRSYGYYYDAEDGERRQYKPTWRNRWRARFQPKSTSTLPAAAAVKGAKSTGTQEHPATRSQ